MNVERKAIRHIIRNHDIRIHLCWCHMLLFIGDDEDDNDDNDDVCVGR